MSKLPEERKQPQSTSTDIVQIPSLPNEMLNEIVGWTAITPGEGTTFKNLCLTSPTLRAIAQPMLLEKYSLGTSAVPQGDRLRQLEALVEKNCHPASKFARTLVIDYSGFFEEELCTVSPPLDVERLDTLSRALESFRRVKKVIWYPRKHEPTWLHQALADALLNIAPNELCVEWLDRPNHYSNTPEMESRFVAFRHILRHLISKSTQLLRLNVNGRVSKRYGGTCYDKINEDLLRSIPANIEHLGLIGIKTAPENIASLFHEHRKLTSLTLHHNLRFQDRYVEPSHLWNFLTEEQIKLPVIDTDTRVDKEFISYLDSYEGLESLTLMLRRLDLHMPEQGRPNVPWEDLCQPYQFLTVLVKRHAHSLVRLGLRAQLGRGEWVWPPVPLHRELLCSLPKLEYLDISTLWISTGETHELLELCEEFFPCLKQLTLDGPWCEERHVDGFYERAAASTPYFQPQFLHYYEDRCDKSDMHQGIITYQSEHPIKGTPFSIVSEKYIYVRRIDPKTGVYGYVLAGTYVHT